MCIVEAVGTSVLGNVITSLGKNIAEYISTTKDDPFLNYDISFCLDEYKKSHPVHPRIPYELEAMLLTQSKNIRVDDLKGEFKIKFPNKLWKHTANNAFHEFKEITKATNGSAIRLEKIKEGKKYLKLVVRECGYYDQARSNLILDYLESKKSKTLRAHLSELFPGRLPPLNCKYLANSVGIAIIVFYKSGSNWLPYMVNRSKRKKGKKSVGVFPGGLHCTSSGVAKWPKKSDSKFDTFFLDHMYQELDEEVKLVKNDLFDVKPIALCREFSRGGKPQIFFGAKTNLTTRELKEKRIIATKFVKQHGQTIEIESRYFESEIAKSAEDLLDNIKKYKITLEGAASLYFGDIYLKSYS